MNIYEIATIVAVLTFVVIAVFLIRALIQIKKTAESVELLTKMTTENIERTKSTFALLDDIATLFNSTFYKALKVGIDLFQLRASRKK